MLGHWATPARIHARRRSGSSLSLLLNHYDDDRPINVGACHDVRIAELAETFAEAVGYSGEIGWDTTKPDGTPRKVLDVTRLTELGWISRIPLAEGIRTTYEWFLAHQADDYRR